MNYRLAGRDTHRIAIRNKDRNREDRTADRNACRNANCNRYFIQYRNAYRNQQHAIQTATETAIAPAIKTLLTTTMPTSMHTTLHTALLTAIKAALQTAMQTAIQTALQIAMQTAQQTAKHIAMQRALAIPLRTAILRRPGGSGGLSEGTEAGLTENLPIWRLIGRRQWLFVHGGSVGHLGRDPSVVVMSISVSVVRNLFLSILVWLKRRHVWRQRCTLTWFNK